MEHSQEDHTVFWIRVAGLVAVLGACIGMVGDYCLLYAPAGGYMAGDYAFLRDIPNSRLIWGHYLGILAIPLEAAGLYLIWLVLQPMGKKIANASVIAGLYIMFAGVAYHGTVYPIADALRIGAGQMEAFRPFNEPLGLGFALAFFILISALTVTIFRGKTTLPKWMAALSPLFSYGLVLVLYVAVPPIGNFLAPMGFNLSMAIFFGFLVLQQRHWYRPFTAPK
jgi:hypothetical protein